MDKEKGTKLTGMDFKEAKKILEEKGFSIRISNEDGINMWGTMDIRPDRVNVDVKNGKITKVLGWW